MKPFSVGNTVDASATATIGADELHCTPGAREPMSLGAEARQITADYRLAARCLTGDVDAWEDLYSQCHNPLCAAIQAMLGRHRGDQDLVDEIAARVWYRLVDNDGELLSRYTPTRGARLTTFMRAVAKDEMCRHFRAAARRRNREFIAVRSRAKSENGEPDIWGSDLKFFLSTLTPQEHAFCQEVLLGEPGTAVATRARTNVWQLTHRVYEKFCRFFAH